MAASSDAVTVPTLEADMMAQELFLAANKLYKLCGRTSVEALLGAFQSDSSSKGKCGLSQWAQPLDDLCGTLNHTIQEIKKAYMTTAASKEPMTALFRVQLFQGLAFVQQTSRTVQDTLHAGMDQVELPSLQGSILASIQLMAKMHFSPPPTANSPQLDGRKRKSQAAQHVAHGAGLDGAYWAATAGGTRACNLKRKAVQCDNVGSGFAGPTCKRRRLAKSVSPPQPHTPQVAEVLAGRSGKRGRDDSGCPSLPPLSQAPCTAAMTETASQAQVQASDAEAQSGSEAQPSAASDQHTMAYTSDSTCSPSHDHQQEQQYWPHKKRFQTIDDHWEYVEQTHHVHYLPKPSCHAPHIHYSLTRGPTIADLLS